MGFKKISSRYQEKEKKKNTRDLEKSRDLRGTGWKFKKKNTYIRSSYETRPFSFCHAAKHLSIPVYSVRARFFNKPSVAYETLLSTMKNAK